MIRWATLHWELKLVALVLAVALWVYTSGQAQSSKQVLVSVRDAVIQGLPEGWTVAAIEPADFKATLAYPVSRAEELRSDQIAPRIELRNLGGKVEPEQTFLVTPRMLVLPPDVRIAATDPPDVTVVVRLDPRVEESLPAATPVVHGVPKGLEQVVSLSATRVKVRGPSRLIEEYRRAKRSVGFRPVDLGDVDAQLAQERVERVVLSVEDPQLQVSEPVTATITLRPASAHRVVTLPILVLAPADFANRWRVELALPAVSVTVRGPGNLLRGLDPERDCSAYVSLRQPPADGRTAEVPVVVAGPPWMQANAVTVRVSLTPVAGPAAGQGPRQNVP